MLIIKTLNSQGFFNRDFEIAFPSPLIKRTHVNFLAERLKGSQIEWIFGPRMCGKTIVLFQLIERLVSRGVDPSTIVYINVSWHKQDLVMKDPLLFKENLRFSLGSQEKVYLFLDGVEHLNKLQEYLSQIQDQTGRIKIFVTSSEDLEITLPNIRVTQLFSLNLVEWMNFKNEHMIKTCRDAIYRAQGRSVVQEIKLKDNEFGYQLKEGFYEMALFGGFPQILILEREKRWMHIQALVQAFLAEESLERHGIDKKSLVFDLMKVLGLQVGQLINYSELSDLLKASHITVKKYHAFLAKVFLVRHLSPLTGRKGNEIKQAKKTFFYDCGLLNFVSGKSGNHIFSVDSSVITNMICSELLKNLNYKSQIFFWQTNTGTSVDLVVQSGTNYFIPLEIKSGEARPKKLNRSFHSFIKTYKPQRAIFVNESLIDYYKVGETEVLYLPYYWVPVLEGLWQ